MRKFSVYSAVPALFFSLAAASLAEPVEEASKQRPIYSSTDPRVQCGLVISLGPEDGATACYIDFLTVDGKSFWQEHFFDQRYSWCGNSYYHYFGGRLPERSVAHMVNQFEEICWASDKIPAYVTGPATCLFRTQHGWFIAPWSTVESDPKLARIVRQTLATLGPKTRKGILSRISHYGPDFNGLSTMISRLPERKPVSLSQRD